LAGCLDCNFSNNLRETVDSSSLAGFSDCLLPGVGVLHGLESVKPDQTRNN